MSLEQVKTRFSRARVKTILSTVFGTLAERPLLTLLSILGLFILGASIAALFKSPAVQFALSVEVRGFEMRVGDVMGIVRDIEGRSLSIDGKDHLDGRPSDPLVARSSTTPFSLDAKAGRLVKLDTLAISPGSVFSIRHASRDETLLITVEAVEQGRDNEATVTWFDRWGDQPSGDLIASAQTISAPRLSIQIDEAATELASTPPVKTKGMQFTTRVTGPDASYPISLVVGGRLQFLVMGTALPEISVGAGEVLHFQELDAELTYLGIEDGKLTLRIFGSADDVSKGFGSATASVYPSAFVGIGAQPVIQVGLSIVVGATLALVGAVSLGSGLGKSTRSRD